MGKNPKDSGFYSPELTGLKHSYLSKDWFSGSPYADLFKGYMEKAATPIERPLGLTPEQQQGQMNMLKANILGMTGAQQGAMTNQMAASGFVPGESGRADTALGGIAQAGQRQFSDSATQMLLDEAKRREALDLETERINTERLLGASKYGELLEQGDLGRLGLGLEAGGFGAGLEQFEKNYGLQQQGLGIQRGALGLERSKFGYTKEQDALDRILEQYDRESAAQKNRYDDYYDSYK